METCVRKLKFRQLVSVEAVNLVPSSKLHGFLAIVILILSIAAVLDIAFPSLVHAANAATLVQQNNGGCGSCGSSTLQVSFSSSVTSGDVIVVGVESCCGAPLSTLNDSLGSSFTPAVASSDGDDNVYIYYATLSTSGTDTITITFAGNAVLGDQNAYLYEISGVTTTGAATGGNAGSQNPNISTTSISFLTGAFLLGMIGTDNNNGGASVNQGAGFSVSAENSGSGFSHAQYATSGVSSPTSFPATITNPQGSYFWAEAGIALEPNCCVTVTTDSSTVTATSDSTSSASTTSGSSQSAFSSTTTTVAASPVLTNTIQTTTTTTAPIAGTSTTTFTSPLSTSYSTASSVASSSTSFTQTGTTTTSTSQSETTTSTGTTSSTTTSDSTITVTQTNTYNVVLIQLFHELEEFETLILQTLGFTITSTPIGQEVSQVVVSLAGLTVTPVTLGHVLVPATISKQAAVTLQVRVTSDKHPVFGATVKFVLNGVTVCTTLSNFSGAASCKLTVTAGKTYNWYAIADKTGYGQGQSATVKFSAT